MKRFGPSLLHIFLSFSLLFTGIVSGYVKNGKLITSDVSYTFIRKDPIVGRRLQELSAKGSGKRRRRTNVRKSPITNDEADTSTAPEISTESSEPNENVDSFSTTISSSTTSSSASALTSSSSASSSTSSGFEFDEAAVAKSLKESKLPPLAGTAAERQAKYNEKSVVQRYAEELLAPTPVGEEPKLVKLAKTVTWGAVLVLVLLEIVVSVKVGGSPFDLSKVSFGGSGATTESTVAPDS